MEAMSSEDGGKLMKDLNQMVNNPELSDIIFNCEDGIQVHACRMLLAARSSFFNHMLLNGMAESRETTIAMPTIASSVLIIVMKFLYVGILLEDDMVTPSPSSDSNCKQGADTRAAGKRSSRWLDTDLLMKVIVASRFLMLPPLERLIMNKLQSNLLVCDAASQPEETLNHVARGLPSICAYPQLWTNKKEVRFIDRIRLPIVQTLLSHDLSVATICSLSREALNYYLAVTRSATKDENWDWSIDEYLRLRVILTWCDTRSKSSEYGVHVYEIDRRCLPGPEAVVAVFEESEKSPKETRELAFDFSHGRSNLVDTISYEDLELLRLVFDARQLPSRLLLLLVFKSDRLVGTRSNFWPRQKF